MFAHLGDICTRRMEGVWAGLFCRYFGPGRASKTLAGWQIRLMPGLAFWCLFHPAAHAATLTVTTLADSTDLNCASVCSLRDAIAAASSGDSIVFSPSLNGGTIALSGSLTIGVNMTITGPGASLLTISGGSVSGQTFSVNATAVNLSGLAITNNTSGSAIFNNGSTLTVSNCTISGNSNPGSGTGGGGLYNQGGSVTLNNCTFSNNSAPNGYGGAILNVNNGPSAVTVNSCTFSGNSAADGGAIFNDQGKTATVINSTFSNNSATADGGAIYNYVGTVSVSDSTFSGNSTASTGGAINNSVNSGVSGTLNIDLALRTRSS